MSAVDEKKQKSDFFRKCLQTFNNNGLIVDYKMMKEDARPLYNNIKKTYVIERIGFSLFLQILNKRKVILNSNNRTVILFNKQMLDIIFDDANFIIPLPISKVIVTQQLAFKKSINNNNALNCKSCRRLFRTKESLEDHYRSFGHLIKASKYKDNSEFIVIEVTEGKGNAPERINCSGKSDLIINIKNVSKEIITMETMHFSSVLKNVSTPAQGEMKPGSKKLFKIAFATSLTNSIDYPLILNFARGSETFQIKKQLYLDFHSAEFDHLHQSAPYVRNKPVVKDIDTTIISGEPLKFAASFTIVNELKRYLLSDRMIKVINSGLNEANLNDDGLKNLCRNMKKTLDVPEPKQCLNAQNYTDILDLLLFFEEHQMQIDIRNYDMEKATLTPTKGKLFKLTVPELSEHRPSLLLGDSVYVTEEKSSYKYRGFVHFKGLDYVELNFHRSFSEKVYVANKKFHVEFGFNRTTLKVEHQAVELIKEHRVAASLFPTKVSGAGMSNSNSLNLSRLNWINKNVGSNAEQSLAVKHILSGTSLPAPYLIFGPPGTGKTTTVVEAIYQVWKLHEKKHILVCTPSNNAANLIAERLDCIPTTQMFRYIAASFPYPEIPQTILKYCNYNGNDYYHPNFDKLMTYRIVITTLTNAGKLYNGGFPTGHFEYVFVDESGHATESESLIAIAGILTSKKGGWLGNQLVLAGDPKQLGPIIHSSKADEYGFGISMLERFMDNLDLYQKHNGSYDNKVLTKLLNNYRSHESILKIPNECFYDNELVPMGSDMSNIGLKADLLPNPNFPIIFHSVFGSDEREASSPSFFNIDEIKTVVKYLDALIGSKLSGQKVTEDHIGIVTPYRKQVKKLKDFCREKRNWKNITIGSVEQLQGQEKMIVIISTVRALPEYLKHDNKYHLGFLKNPKRFNVAITRAKALLIVIGQPELLQCDEHWWKFLKYCKDNNACCGQKFVLKSPEEAASKYDEVLDGVQNLSIVDTGDFGRGNR